MVLLARKRILAAALETTTGPGTAETLTEVDAAINVFDARLGPAAEFDEREGQGSLSPIAGVPGALVGECTFWTELIGGPGAGVQPLWAAVLLPACGFVDATGGVYGPVSEGPGMTNVKTVTLGLYQDGKVRTLRGAAGNVVFRMTSGRMVRAEFTFRGIWDGEKDDGLLTPTYPTEAPLKFTGSGLAIDSWEPKVSELALDLGGDVQMREDSADVSGYASAVITGRRVRITFNPEATLIGGAGGHDVYGEWAARTPGALSLALGDGENGVAFAAPAVQIVAATPEDRAGIAVDSVEIQCNRSADLGDDELTITVHEPA